MTLFFSDRLACGGCHGGFNLSGPTDQEGADPVTPTFHNTALYNVDGRGAYPAADRGLIDKTGRPADMGSFRAPTLRNVAVTAPYMHDGSVPTLEAAIAHYATRGVARPAPEPPAQGLHAVGAGDRRPRRLPECAHRPRVPHQRCVRRSPRVDRRVASALTPNRQSAVVNLQSSIRQSAQSAICNANLQSAICSLQSLVPYCQPIRVVR